MKDKVIGLFHKLKITKRTDNFAANRFVIMVGASVVVSVILVVVALQLYNTSGAAQLDLSRPGYKSVSSKASTKDDDISAFPSDGSINEKVINDFKKSYNNQLDKIKSIDPFSGDALSDQSLGIDNSSN
jgi:hypothetical protein